MVVPTFTPGYPPDGSSLGQTKATIRNNLDGTFQTLAIDHINNNGQPGSQPAGYHTIIHQVPQTSVTTVAGYNQVFSGVPGTLVVNATPTRSVPNNGDQQLYSLTGAGILSQLTGKSATTNGYCWSGGILFQWGQGNNGGSFPVAFSTLFTVIATPFTAPGFLNSIPSITSQNTSSFAMGNSGGQVFPVNWIAIGN